jgi:copper oxidase (laccase) domain-containing protein
VDSVHEARQVHGSDLAVTGPYSSCYRGVDGLFSARSGSLLTIRTADCYPVFVRDVSNPRFCLLHAGWRGLADGIISKALNNWFDGPVELILGAGIGASEYEVGEDVVHAFSETLGMDVESMKQRGILSGACLDLKEIIAREADRADVTVRSIARFPSSTTAGNESPPLLSYRDDGTEDRMISWIFHRRR